MKLNATRVHLIRSTGKTDRYWGRIWRLRDETVRDARIGKSWPNHPTPPDCAPRTKGSGDEAVAADPRHFRLLDEEGLDPFQYVDKRVPASSILTLEEVRNLPSIIICSGVYFLWRENDLLYVGQSRLVGQRLIEHEKASVIPFTHHTCLQCNYDQLDTVEYDYIEHLKPPYNKQIHRPGAPKAPLATENPEGEHP